MFVIKADEFYHTVSKDERAYKILMKQSEERDQNTLKMLKKFAHRLRNGNASVS